MARNYRTGTTFAPGARTMGPNNLGPQPRMAPPLQRAPNAERQADRFDFLQRQAGGRDPRMDLDAPLNERQQKRREFLEGPRGPQQQQRWLQQGGNVSPSIDMANRMQGGQGGQYQPQGPAPQGQSPQMGQARPMIGRRNPDGSYMDTANYPQPQQLPQPGNPWSQQLGQGGPQPSQYQPMPKGGMPQNQPPMSAGNPWGQPQQMQQMGPQPGVWNGGQQFGQPTQHSLYQNVNNGSAGMTSPYYNRTPASPVGLFSRPPHWKM